MSFKSEDEAHAAIELASMRNGGSFSFDNSPAPSTLASHTAAQASSSPSIDRRRSSKPKSDTHAASSSAPSTSKVRLDDDNITTADLKSKKRKRVVVACDTCRRKKVKCEGLPNPSNTCNNCIAYNYRCAFTGDVDRSRGKYEILESKVETLLSALRSVAPQLAQQFENGELNITGPSGSGAPPENANAWQLLVSNTHKNRAGEHDELDSHQRHSPDDPSESHLDKWPSQSRQLFSAPDAADEEEGEDADIRRDSSRNDKHKQEDRDALLPDVEEGRPRYYGRSSAMTLFHSIADESRPPSPSSSSRQNALTNHAGISYETSRPTSIRAQVQPHVRRVTGTTPRPLYPTNSKEWILLLRRKNTVAIGRDDAVTEEWFERYTLPDEDLVKDLLDLYFDRLHPLMPIVHRPSLDRDLKDGRADKDSAFRGFVFTILAIASRFSSDVRVLSDPNDSDTAGDHFAAASRLYHQVYAASLINVQVMLLTATFMHGSIGPGASWTVLGVAIRALQDIGLHQEKAYRGFTPYEQEIRRRVFWGAFILDCIFSVNMGRPLALKLSDCDVRLPLEIDDDDLFRYESGGLITVQPPTKPIVMSGLVHMIKLNVIVQDVVHTLYTPRWRQEVGSRKLPQRPKQRAMPEYKDMAILSKRLEEWVAETPRHLRTLDSPFKLQAGLVQCGTHDIRLYILKPFLEHAALRKMLHPQCVFHARECLKVVIELYEGAHVTDLVFIFQQAFMSTATFMITVWHETREVDKLAEDNDLVEATLRTFASFDDRYFSKLFRRAHRILRDITLRTMHVMNSDQRERVSRLLQRNEVRLPGLGTSALLGMKPTPSEVLVPRTDSVLAPSTRIIRGDRRRSIQHSEMGPTGAEDPVSAAAYIHSWSPIPSAPISPNRTPLTESSGATFPPHDNHSSMSFAHFMMSNATPSRHQRLPSSGNIDHSFAGEPFHGSPDNENTPASGSGTVESSGVSGVHPASYGDARGIMPFYTANSDDPGTAQHQLEDLSWTDYFSRFLDDISTATPGNQPGPYMGGGGAGAGGSTSNTNSGIGTSFGVASPSQHRTG